MAECEICKREMLTSEGCNIEDIIIDGKIYNRIKVGNKNDFYEDIKEKEFRCHDCGAKKGNYHHWGCDAETCPACKQQLISCECKNAYITELESKEDSIKYDEYKQKQKEINKQIKQKQKEIGKIRSEMLKKEIESGRVQTVIVEDKSRLY